MRPEDFLIFLVGIFAIAVFQPLSLRVGKIAHKQAGATGTSLLF